MKTTKKELLARKEMLSRCLIKSITFELDLGLARQLLPAGADPTWRDVVGLNSFQYAASSENAAVRELILPLATDDELRATGHNLGRWSPAQCGFQGSRSVLKTMLAVLLKRGLPVLPAELEVCRSKSSATAAMGLMTSDGLAAYSLSKGRWAGLAAEALAKREKAELRKAAKRPKAAAKAVCRL